MSDLLQEKLDQAAAIMTTNNIPAATVSVVSGLSTSEISQLFARKRTCPIHRVMHILACVQALAELAQAIAPVPVDWRRSEVLSAAIRKIERGDLKVLTIDFASGVQALNDVAEPQKKSETQS
jgi:hypothetical protein